jgi:hypothetical protein
VVEHLPSNHKAMSLNPRTVKKKQQKTKKTKPCKCQEKVWDRMGMGCDAGLCVFTPVLPLGLK